MPYNPNFTSLTLSADGKLSVVGNSDNHPGELIKRHITIRQEGAAPIHPSVDGKDGEWSLVDDEPFPAPGFVAGQPALAIGHETFVLAPPASAGYFDVTWAEILTIEPAGD